MARVAAHYSRSETLYGNQRALKHGHTWKCDDGKIGKSATYNSWEAMRKRCVNPHNKAYVGVTCAPEWCRFDAFLADMGERPAGMTLDRIDNSKGYRKENCRWATPTTQSRNRRVTKRVIHEGDVIVVAQWAERSGISYKSAIRKYHRGEVPRA